MCRHGCDSMNGHGRSWWKIELLPDVDDIAEQTIGSPDLLHGYAKAY